MDVVGRARGDTFDEHFLLRLSSEGHLIERSRGPVAIASHIDVGVRLGAVVRGGDALRPGNDVVGPLQNQLAKL